MNDTTMQATVRWRGEASFEGLSGSGHRVVMDGPPDHGGSNQGPRPMEALLLGVGACAAFDIVRMLRKSRQPITGCEARLRAERSDVPPAVFTRIELVFRISGAVGEPQARRAVALSAEKYCSASIMLSRAGVEVSHRYEIVP